MTMLEVGNCKKVSVLKLWLAARAGHAGMEAAIASLVEPGETVLIGNNGIWGTRAADIAGRYGGAAPLSPHVSQRDCINLRRHES